MMDDSQLWVFRARVEKVIDGDTLELTVDVGFHTFKLERFRVLGVDTPELKGPTRDAGLRAKAFTQQWVSAAEVADPKEPWPFFVQTSKTDNFGRYLVTIWRVDRGTSLADDLIDSGNAVKYRA